MSINELIVAIKKIRVSLNEAEDATQKIMDAYKEAQQLSVENIDSFKVDAKKALIVFNNINEIGKETIVIMERKLMEMERKLMEKESAQIDNTLLVSNNIDT